MNQWQEVTSARLANVDARISRLEESRRPALQKERATDPGVNQAHALGEALRELVADIEASNDVEFTGSLLRAKGALDAAGVAEVHGETFCKKAPDAS
jgi:hypothetical protein